MSAGKAPGSWKAALIVALLVIILLTVVPFALIFVRDVAQAPGLAGLAAALDRWQTLLAGGLALVGAAVAALVVTQQIEAARDLEGDRRRRRAAAGWADLSHHLSGCLRWLEAAARTQRELMEYAWRNPEAGIDGIWTVDPRPVPSPPEGLAEAVRDLIEVCEIHQIKPLSSFSRCVQTCHSQLVDGVRCANGEETPGQGPGYLISVYVRFVDLAAQCTALFAVLDQSPDAPIREVGPDELGTARRLYFSLNGVPFELREEIDRRIADRQPA